MSSTGQASSTELGYKVYSQTRDDREHPFSELIDKLSDQDRGAALYNKELKKLEGFLLQRSVADVQVIVTDSDLSHVRGVSFKSIIDEDHPSALSLSLDAFRIQRSGDTRSADLYSPDFPVVIPSDDRLPSHLRDLVVNKMADTSLDPEKQHMSSILTEVVTATGSTEKLADEVAKTLWAHPHFGKCADPECGYACPIVVIPRGSKEFTDSFQKIQTTDILSPSQVNSLAKCIAGQEACGQQLTTLFNIRKPTVCFVLATDPDDALTTLSCARVEAPIRHSAADQEGVTSDRWVITSTPLCKFESLDLNHLGEVFKDLTKISDTSRGFHQARQGLRGWERTGISVYAEPWISAHKAQVSAAEKK